MPGTCIVVPCYNESGRLDASEFIECARRMTGLTFLFVNDGSRDGTSEILEGMRRVCPDRIRYIDLGKNNGKAEAVRRGFLESFESGFEFIGYWDADLATPLETIPRFRGLLEGGAIDGVLGSRVLLLGRHIRRKPARHYFGRVFATFASMAIGLPVYDTQCGAKIFRNTERLRQVFSVPFRVNWTFDVEIMARFLLLERSCGGPKFRDRFIEYPLERWVDIPGSKLKLLDFLLGAWEVLVIAHGLRSTAAKREFLESLENKDKGRKAADGSTEGWRPQ